ncbi:MAG: hypothetical protein Q9185_003817 [Variospora sp. 1 TL-2023]
MTDELENEIEAINSIYGADTILKVSQHAAQNHYTLVIPQADVTLRILIPDQYPETCLQFTAVDGVGPTAPKGFGSHVLITARGVVQRVYTPGQVCLFDVLQELEQTLDHESSTLRQGEANVSNLLDDAQEHVSPTIKASDTVLQPHWTLSTTVTEKKSSFLARSCAVNTTVEAQFAFTQLLATDKRAKKATHNISAYRIRTSADGNKVVFQDCDDDGETAAGARLLKLLQIMDVWNVLVVVSRWYGGVKLGPARFGIINAVAREALVAGSFAKG